MFVEFRIKNRINKPAVYSDGGKIFMPLKSEHQVISRFLDAVITNPDDAWAFVSKVYSPLLDLNELREVLGLCVQIKVSKAFYLNDTKNCLTRSVYVENPALNLRRLLHLRIIKDGGAWKIFSVEQEECKK